VLGPSCGGVPSLIVVCLSAVVTDATQAISTFHRSKLDGRALQVVRAKPKHTHDAGMALKEGEATKISSSKAAEATDYRDRTVVVWGLSPALTERALRVRFRKVGAVESIRFPMKPPGTVRVPGTDVDRVVAHVTMMSIADARALCKKMEGHSIQGSTLQLRLIPSIVHASVAKTKCRVIVRNLPFRATEASLWNAFSPVGPLASVHIPTVTVSKPEDSKSVSRGFGFVQFATREDAVRAVQLSSAGKTKVEGRQVVADLATTKAVFEAKQAEEAAKKEEEEAKEADADDKDGGAVEDVEEKEHDEKADDEDDAEEEDADDEDDAEEEDADDDDAEEEDADDEDDAEEEDADDDDADEEDGTASETPGAAPNDVGEGRTLFLRNVPFDATNRDVRSAFARFGKITFAAIVKDQATGQCKGTAFVKFESDDSVRAVLEECPEDLFAAARSSSGSSKMSAEAAMALASGISSRGVEINGRRIIVKAAVDRDRAKELASGQDKKERGKWEKRHLYLAKEGLIQGDAAMQMPPQDRQKREKAQFEKNQKLKSPLFFVSPTKLSVRNLHKSVDEKKLREACLQAAVEGMRSGVVQKNEGDPLLRPARGSNPQAKVAKVILFRETAFERASKKGGAAAKAAMKALDTAAKRRKAGTAEGDGEMEGYTSKGAHLVGESKGFAFVEFGEHIHALACLRVLNNNPAFSYLSLGGGGAMGRPEQDRSRLLVEFAIENAAKLKIQEKRRESAAVKLDKMVKVHGSEEAARAAMKAAKEADEEARKLRRKEQKKAWKAWRKSQMSGLDPDEETGRRPSSRPPKRGRDAPAAASSSSRATASSEEEEAYLNKRPKLSKLKRQEAAMTAMEAKHLSARR
jgi:nucleolar protein 4